MGKEMTYEEAAMNILHLVDYDIAKEAEYEIEEMGSSEIVEDVAHFLKKNFNNLEEK